MVILRAIGNFFVRIGRWIKNTAWIQPLLIVGGIFGIIFAIPHITTWVKSWATETSAAETYYKNRKISLDGAEEGTSDLDKLLEKLEAGDTEEITSKYGEKFFLTFVQEGCQDCEDRYGGFQLLEKDWGKGEFSELEGSFKLHTVFIDSENDDGDNLFKELYKRDTITKLFEETTEVLQDQNSHPYALNCSVGSTSYKSSLEKINDPDNFFSPTTILLDFTNDAPAWTSACGISEVLFSFEGDSDISFARTLANAWACEDVFSPEYKK